MKRKTYAFLLLILLPFFCYAQKHKSGKANSKPITIGHTEELFSRQLGEKRQLNIYLPEGYNAADTVKYPVIYLLDGGVDEDFIHVTGLVQFNTFPWVNRLQPSIVVGIVNLDRKRDLTFPTTVKSDKEKFPTTGGSAKFISFIEKELQPYIDKRYRTGSSKTLIGESLGGLLATEILFTRPSLFDKYIIISPSLWWDNGSLLDRKDILAAASPSQNLDIYIGVGKEGLAPTEKPHVMEVDANLLADKLTSLKNKQLNVHFDYLPDENHATIAHQALLNALKWLAERK